MINKIGKPKCILFILIISLVILTSCNDPELVPIGSCSSICEDTLDAQKEFCDLDILEIKDDVHSCLENMSSTSTTCFQEIRGLQ